MTPKEKEWVRRIDSIPVIEEFDNTLVVGKSGNTGMIDELENTPVVEVLDSNQCPVEPQVDSEDKSTIKEHLPLPKYFDCEKLKRNLEQAGLPAKLSTNAGTSFCNELYWNGLRYIKENKLYAE